MGDDVPDTTDISTKKAKAQNLMNLLSNYSAWFVDGHLMMRPGAFLEPWNEINVRRDNGTCSRRLRTMHITFPSTMTELDDDLIPKEVPFVFPAEKGKICIILKQGDRISASTYDIDRLKVRSTRPTPAPEAPAPQS